MFLSYSFSFSFSFLFVKCHSIIPTYSVPSLPLSYIFPTSDLLSWIFLVNLSIIFLSFVFIKIFELVLPVFCKD